MECRITRTCWWGSSPTWRSPMVNGKFSWQEGFGAFSYSHSQLGAVARYIENQETHHAKRSFKEEYLALLRKFDIAYDEKYLFEWIEE